MLTFFRGRPRTVSLDSESKIPKKRKKKRQPKYVDDDMIDDLSDMSNGEDVYENDVDSEGAPKISSTNPERPPQLPVAPGHVGVSNTTNS